MTTVALIPLRGGSKSIPLKNIKLIAGKPLCAWIIEAACSCKKIDRVLVSTDSARIAEVVSSLGTTAEVIHRAPHLATDTASTESVILDVAVNYAFDLLVTLQATSPLTNATHLAHALSIFDKEELDSMLTAVRMKRFFWRDDATPINYDPARRPRRQDFAGTLMENGAFYITRREIIDQNKCRLGGKIGIYEMPDNMALEIDEPEDWPYVEAAIRDRVESAQALSAIRAVVLDVDGTLTDGAMFYSADGEAFKKFNTRDGHGIQLLRDAGFLVCVATRESSDSVAARMVKLNVRDYLPGLSDKANDVQAWLESNNIAWNEVAMMGDDENDAECLRRCGFAACPSDAHDSVRPFVHWTSRCQGGNGAVRELADLLIASRRAGKS